MQTCTHRNNQDSLVIFDYHSSLDNTSRQKSFTIESILHPLDARAKPIADATLLFDTTCKIMDYRTY